ncbi:MAG: DUF1080 domain-containing protein [Pedobacter sp.]|nr:MAG: DUF1080 domain-containing protein [Pedobacter sp.]
MMKSTLLLFSSLLFAVVVSAQKNPQVSYTFNRLPLKQDTYAQLPLGSIKAKGWLLKQLELQKNGFTGHAEELYPEKDNLGSNTDWLGGTGNSWEKVPYYVKGLVALAYTLDDASLRIKAEKWISYTLDHQQENGLFGPPKMQDWWPRMPFMYAVQSFYEATGDQRVIPFLSKYFKYQLDNLDKDPLKSWGKSRAGDNMEIALWLYNKTGDKFLLDLVEKLKKQAYPWADIYNNNQFLYYGSDYQPKHMVNVAQALKFPAVYAQVNPSLEYTGAMQKGIDHLMHHHGQPQGVAAGTEFVSGKSSIQGVETCTVVEWMQSLETASRVIHNAEIGDQLEKAAFNALPAQFSRDLKGHSYYTLPNQVQNVAGPHGFNQDYSSGIVKGPYSGFPCCRYNMHMGWPYFVKNSWLATPDGGLAVNTYGPMEVNAVVANNVKVKIDEETSYPFEEQIRFKVSLDRSATFPVKFRIPGWSVKPEVLLNGKALQSVKAGEIFTIHRKWVSGDKVTLNFPMKLAATEQVNNGISVERGPLLYALKIQPAEKVIKEFANGFNEVQVTPASAWNYGLDLGGKNLEAAIQIVKSEIPENPYASDKSPIQLKVKAKLIPGWSIDYYKTAAMDVPYSPLISQAKQEVITLVPFGSVDIRLSIFPTIGKPALVNKTYAQTFDNNTADGLVIYGGSWFYKENKIHCAPNEDGGSGPGTKIIATATNFTNFTYNADVSVNTSGDAGLLFRITEPAIGSESYRGYYLGLNPETGKIELGKSSQSKWIVIASATYPLKLKESHPVQVKVIGDKIVVYIDGNTKPVITASDSEFKSGSIGLRAYKALVSVDNIKVNAI